MAYLRIVETSLADIIQHHAVDNRTVALLQHSLPLMLDDMPAGCLLTAADVFVGADGLRITPSTGSGGSLTADWGALMLQALDASPVESRRLRRVARQCLDGGISSTADLRLALERSEAANIHTWVVAAIAIMLALLVWLNNL